MTFKPGDKPKTITSAKQIERLTERGRYRDHEVKGLYLQVINATNRSWVLRFQIAGRQRALGLGAFPLIGLREAREKAREARRKLVEGEDPIEQRRERMAALMAKREKALTFAQTAERYDQAKGHEWKDRQRKAFASILRTYTFPIIGKLEVAAVDTAAVLRVLQPIWTEKPAIAKIARSYIERVLAWAQVSGFRSGDNPARWRGHLKEALASHAKTVTTQHHAAMPHGQVPAFMAELRGKEGVTARALEFLILTGMRTETVTGTRWDEIDLENAVWTAPAERMKGGKHEFRIALSSAAIALLQAMPREHGNLHVFPGRKSGSCLTATVLWHFLKAMKRDDATPHGFRSSFRDWAGDCTSFPGEIAEAALAHVVGTKVERSYRRGDALDQRRPLMEAWGRYCNGETHEGGKVIPLKRKEA